jgi:para-nitrobenzyl esterase
MSNRSLGRWHRILGALLGFAAGAAIAQQGPVATTAEGRLRGVHEGALDVYRGVPYARPPVGPLRWRAPAASQPWKGIRAADAFSASCYQGWPVRGWGPYTAEYLDVPRPSEDCLYLNIWTPGGGSGAPLPVLVWIHGGGFGGGSGAIEIYNGSRLAAQGIVVVTINYRVGPFGFLALPALEQQAPGEGAGNYGLEDMIAALRWIQRNIGAFGGDPGRVTIAGQSAGALGVDDLLIAPEARGLFAGAIAQSGSGMGVTALPREEALRNGQQFADLLGAHTLAELRALPPEKIQAALPSFPPSAADAGRPRIPFRPVLDAVVLTADAADGASPAASRVPLLTGYNSDEFLAMEPITARSFEHTARARYGTDADRFLALYPHEDDTAALQAAHDLARDNYMAALLYWSRAHTARNGSPVYAYLFAHPSPVSAPPSFGAFHTAEVPYVFGVLDRARRPYTDADDAVSRQLQGYWLNFIRHGDPNGEGLAPWQAVTEGSMLVMQLGDKPGMRPALSTPAREAAFERYLAGGHALPPAL